MPIQTSFNAGEFSDLIDGAVDLDKRAWSVKLMQNMLALKQGPAVRRGPTVFVKEVKTSSKQTYLIPFQFSDDQSYVIEVGHQYFRFYKNYANIKNLGSPYEISTPYGTSDLFSSSDGLFQLQFVQSADALYIVHGDFAPRVLTRTSDTSWALNTLVFDDGPYLDENTTTTTMSLSATTGSVTITASTSTFASTDVGRLIRIKHSSTWGWAKITGYTSATVVTASVGSAFGGTGAVTTWRLGVWSDRTGWPRAITFFQDRLVMGGSKSYPDRYDLTKTSGYSSTTATFQPTLADGTVADDNAISGYVPSGQVNKINWMVSDLRGLVIGTSKEEFVVRANTLGEAITPSNATSSLFSATGSAYIQPVRTVNGNTFVQKARRRVFDIVYSFEDDTLKPIDVTLLAEHITRGRVSGMCYQQEPVNIIWGWTSEGNLIALTHYPDQKIWAWHRHYIGGYSDSGVTPSKVESLTVIPSSDGSRDDLWLVVRRLINGVEKRYIEYMTPYYEDDQDLTVSAQVDSRFEYNSAATNVVTGIDHLEGETVKVMVDGKSHPDLVVSSGEITLENDVTGKVIQVGLPYTWRLIPNKYEVKFQDGETAQGKQKRIISFVMRLLNTLGLSYGEPNTTLIEYDFEQGQSYDTNPELFSGDTDIIVWPGGTNTDGQMEFSSDSVFPATIVALMTKVKVQP